MSSAGLLPALALIAGAICGTFADESRGPALWLSPAAAGAALLSWWRRADLLTCALLAAGFAAGGAALACNARQRALHPQLRTVLDGEFGGFSVDDPGPEPDHDPAPVRMMLEEDASRRTGFVSLRVRVVSLRLRDGWHPVDGSASLSVSGEAAGDRVRGWTAGRSIEAPVAFRRPSRYLDDGVPDFERDLALGGIALFGSIKSGLLVGVTAPGTVTEEFGAAVRAHVRGAMERWVAPHDAVAGAIVTAVLIGDRTGLPNEIRDRLQAAGTYHVIAISGGNIAILAGVILGLLRLAGVHGRAAALIAIVTLLLYSQVATAGPSVWRATLMAVLYLGARLLDHRTLAWQAAAVAAALMIVLRPLDVRDPGFILTFGATVALLEGARRGRALLPRNPLLAWIAASVMASLAVEVVLLPVSAQMFSRVTAAGLLLNLVAVPMMGLAQVAGLITAAFRDVEAIAAIAGWTGYAAAATLVESARLVEVVPWLTRRVPAPGLALVIAYYATLAGVMGPRRWRVRLPAAVACGASLILIGGAHPLRGAGQRLPAGLRLTLFDVGQGEAMLLQAGRRTLQIDAGGAPFGGEFDIGARVLAPALWARGIHALDTLLVTHGDPDHVGGARVLVDDFPLRALWEGIDVPAHAPSRELRERAAARGVAHDWRRAGDTLEWEGARIRVLHPPAPDWERPRVRNDDSVVLEVVYGDTALLLTGDVGAEVERGFIPLLTPAATRVLKVAHHGSRTSTSRDLVEAWRPQIALISAGRGNTFGHPTPEVLQRLQAAGASVYRTDLHGQITLDTDGRVVRVTTFTPDIERSTR